MIKQMKHKGLFQSVAAHIYMKLFAGEEREIVYLSTEDYSHYYHNNHSMH